MVELFVGGMDMVSRKWLLFDGEQESYFNPMALENAVAIQIIQYNPLWQSMPLSYQCYTKALVSAERELENYTLGRCLFEQPLATCLGFDEPIEQRFRMSLTRNAPELIVSSYYSTGHLMLGKVPLDTSETLQTTTTMCLSVNNLNKPLVSVVINSKNPRTWCECEGVVCTCDADYPSLEAVQQQYFTMKRTFVRSPWEAFSKFVITMPSIRRQMNGILADYRESTPFKMITKNSTFSPVRNTCDIEAMKFKFMRNFMRKVGLLRLDRFVFPPPKHLSQQKKDEEIRLDITMEENYRLAAKQATENALGHVRSMLRAEGLLDPDPLETDPAPESYLNAELRNVDNLNLPTTDFESEEPLYEIEMPVELLGMSTGPRGVDGRPVDALELIPPTVSADLELYSSPIAQGSPMEGGEKAATEEETLEQPPVETKPTCPHCGSTFKRRYEMDRHVRSIHLKQKRHQCEVCSKEFFQRSHLKVHMEAVHEQRKSDMCNICGRLFSTKYKVDRHIRSVHLHERSHCCHICGSDYYQSSDLRRHMKLQHSEHVVDKAVTQPLNN